MWTLYKIKPYKDYPSTTYFWVDDQNNIVYQRDITPLGYVPVQVESAIGHSIKEITAKKITHKANQEQMEMGWLLL